MRNLPVVIIATLIFVGLAQSGALAERDADPAGQFIDSLGQEILTIIRAPDTTPTERHAKLSALLRSGVDLPRLGRFALGRHWKSATPEQRDEFQALFANYVLRSYIRLLGVYDMHKFSVQTVSRRRGSDRIVQSRIERRTGEAFDLRWRVRESAGQYRVIDLTTGGLSLAVTYRSEFASVVASRGIDGLLEALRSGT